jgi:sterol desaturase/sphingolipid hydroxylase (fatty acid hydroxylase superfamily)
MGSITATVLHIYASLVAAQIFHFLLVSVGLIALFEFVPLLLMRRNTLVRNFPDFFRFHLARGAALIMIGTAFPFLYYALGLRHGLVEMRHLPLIVQVIVLYLCAEFCIYWSHRIAHRRKLPLLSKAHRFHHEIVEDLEWVNGKKEHFLVLSLFAAIFSIVFFVLFEASSLARSLTLGLYLVLNALSHFGVPFRIPYVDHIFLFPADHRRHHTARSGPYGVTLSLFDTIFDTRGGR